MNIDEYTVDANQVVTKDYKYITFLDHNGFWRVLCRLPVDKIVETVYNGVNKPGLSTAETVLKSG